MNPSRRTCWLQRALDTEHDLVLDRAALPIGVSRIIRKRDRGSSGHSTISYARISGFLHVISNTLLRASCFRRRTGLVAALAFFAEDVIEKMTPNHEATTYHRDGHFRQMRWQAVATVSTCKYQKQTAAHENRHAGPAVPEIAREHSHSTDRSYKQCKNTMHAFLRGYIVRPYSQKRDRYWRKNQWMKQSTDAMIPSRSACINKAFCSLL